MTFLKRIWWTWIQAWDSKKRNRRQRTNAWEWKNQELSLKRDLGF